MAFGMQTIQSLHRWQMQMQKKTPLRVIGKEHRLERDGWIEPTLRMVLQRHCPEVDAMRLVFVKESDVPNNCVFRVLIGSFSPFQVASPAPVVWSVHITLQLARSRHSSACFHPTGCGPRDGQQPKFPTTQPICHLNVRNLRGREEEEEKNICFSSHWVACLCLQIFTCQIKGFQLEVVLILLLVRIRIFSRGEIGARNWHSAQAIANTPLPVKICAHQAVTCIGAKLVQIDADRIREGATETE